MTMPGITDEPDLKRLLKRLIEDQQEILKFAVVARGPKDGDLILSRKEKLKKKEVRAVAEAQAKEQNGGKKVKLDVMSGECRLHARGSSTLLLIVHGKATARAVACVEHLLARGPYKSVGFTEVVLEEIEETDDVQATPTPTGPPGATQAESPVDPTANVPPAPAIVPPSEPALRFNERLKVLLPAIRATVGTAAEGEVKSRASEAGAFARQRDFERADRLLDEVESLLRSVDARREDTQSAVRFNERLKQLLPSLKAALGTPTGDEARSRTADAGALARQQNFARANQLLDEVEMLVKKSAPIDPQADTAAQAKAEQFQREWAAARRNLRLAIDQVQDQLRELAAVLLQSDDPNMIWVAEEGLTQVLGGLRASANTVDRLANKNPAKIAAFAKPAIAELEKRLAGEQVKVCDQNQFGVKVSIRRSIEAALAEMSKVLEGAV